MLVARNVCAYLLILTLIYAFVICLMGTRYDMLTIGYYSIFRPQEDAIYIRKPSDAREILNLPIDAVIDAMGDNQLMETYWRGLNGNKKRMHVLQFLKNKKCHIYCLQDTHFTPKDILKVADQTDRYINTLQVLCRNQTRLGSMKDGGKEICVDDLYRPKNPCLVYSFGSNFQFDFEVAVIQNFKCEVHTFDPSKLVKQRQTIPSGINFHLVGLSNRTYTSQKKWKMETLSSIRTSLNHSNRIIDILKIDIEGGEWTALPEIISSGIMKNVRQLCVEIHFGFQGKYRTTKLWGDVTLKHQLKVLRLLYEEEFHIFMHEHNQFSLTSFKQPFPRITTVNEISLINTRWNK